MSCAFSRYFSLRAFHISFFRFSSVVLVNLFCFDITQNPQEKRDVLTSSRTFFMCPAFRGKKHAHRKNLTTILTFFLLPLPFCDRLEDFFLQERSGKRGRRQFLFFQARGRKCARGDASRREKKKKFYFYFHRAHVRGARVLVRTTHFPSNWRYQGHPQAPPARFMFPQNDTPRSQAPPLMWKRENLIFFKC